MSLNFESEITKIISHELQENLRKHYQKENKFTVIFYLNYYAYIGVNAPVKKMIIADFKCQFIMSESVNVSKVMLYNQVEEAILYFKENRDIAFKNKMGIMISASLETDKNELFRIDMKEYLFNRLQAEEIQKEKKMIKEKINEVSEKNKLTRL